MSENGEFMSLNSMDDLRDNGLSSLDNMFYLNSLEDNCFSKYGMNGGGGINRASGFCCPHVDGFSSEYKGMCPNNDENCRRKRCSDRYDSSESSDSGIAVSSSASSNTGDITDPGSPFSTSSEDSSSSPGKCKDSKRCKSEEKSPGWSEPTGRCRSEIWSQGWDEKQADKTDNIFITPETDFKMAPNVPSAPDIWASVKGNHTANETAHFNQFKNKSEAIIYNNKRLKIDDDESLIAPLNINNNNIVPSLENKDLDVTVRWSSVKPAKNDEKLKVKTCEKSVGCVAKPKTDRNRHQGKITEYFKSQIKPLVGVKRDFNYLKKDLFQSKPKTLAVVTKKLDDPPAKKLKNETGTVFVKPSPKPVQTVMPFPEPPCHPALAKLPKTPEFLLNKPPQTKTLFNKILQNHKNRKLAETNFLKTRASSIKAKQDESKKSQKPYESSTRHAELPNNNNNNNVNKSMKLDELSSNLDDKVQIIKKLDSSLLFVDSKKITDIVNREVVISNIGRADAVESESSSSSDTPILSAPKTIRFPVNSCRNDRDNKHIAREIVSCRWDACTGHFESASGLLDHLQTAHVLTQVSGEKFVCLWVGCKVFDQKSCSRSWLERHVLSHAGNKPYRCIVDGCGQGFSSQAILERHVNSHFQADVKKALDSSIAHKLFRRNGKKLRYRRQPWSARMFDFFDPGIMECLEHRLVKLTKTRTGGDIADTPGKSLALTSQVVARRMADNGKPQFLLRWYPLDIVEDEWVYEKEIKRRKMVSIPSLSPSESSSLQDTLELATRTPGASKRKNKGTCQKKQQAVEEPIPMVTEPEPEVLPEVEKDLKTEEPVSPKKVPNKKPKGKKNNNKKIKSDMIDPDSLPIVSIPVVDISKDGTLTAEKTVSLKPKEEEKIKMIPEEMSVVPVCHPQEELIPIQANSGMMTPMKTEMILSSPVKLVTSQYIEQPFLQTVMPVQMPVTYQIPFVKLNQPSGMFLPQIPNYIISQSPTVFPQSPFRGNGFQLSNLSTATGTIQIQTSTTTLHQTASNFMQSTTNTSGFQILQTPGALQQSILTAFQNSGITNLNLKSSPTLRLLNCQPLILNNAKPMSMTLATANVSARNVSALMSPPPQDSNKSSRKIISPTKKIMKQKLNILPKPNNISTKNGVSDGSKNSKKQCLQPCGPTTRAAT